MNKIPVLVYTDDGRDVDDIEAITYLAGSENIDIVAIVTTHMIPDRRARIVRGVMDNLGRPSIPIGVGSVFPIGKEDKVLVRYLRDHTIQNRTYEGEGMIECFPDGLDLICETVRRYGSDLIIAVQAPMTDLAKAAMRDETRFSKIKGLYIQAQATVAHGKIYPSIDSYNIKEDEFAARIIFDLQARIPLTLVGKFSAYSVPFTRSDLRAFRDTGNPVGAYLLTHAEKGLECFARRDPKTFRRVFGAAPEDISSIEEISNPYDALVAKAIANPSGLVHVSVGRHRLIGMSESARGVLDAEAVKQDLIQKMMIALGKRSDTV